MSLTESEVRGRVADTIEYIIDEFKNQPDVDREIVIERLDENCDDLWGSLVKHGLISEYDVDDLIQTTDYCATILKVAKDDAWVEDDYGLWDGLTCGVLASIAYFSLRNLLYQKLRDEGFDTNDEHPFVKDEE